MAAVPLSAAATASNINTSTVVGTNIEAPNAVDTEMCMCPCSACKNNCTVLRNNNSNNNNNNNNIAVEPLSTAKKKRKSTASNNDTTTIKKTKKSSADVMVDAIISCFSDRKSFVELTHPYRKMKCNEFKFQMFAMCLSRKERQELKNSVMKTWII